MHASRRQFADRLYAESHAHDQGRPRLERDNLAAAGLADRVSLRVQDAARTLSEAADGEWEFVFLDSERPAYVGYLPDLVRTLASGGVLAVDNVLSHEDELVEFTERIGAVTELTQTVVTVGAGLRVAVRDPS